MFDYPAQALARVRRQWTALVLLGLATDVLLVILLAGPAAWATRWLIGTHDTAAVSNTQLVGFLLSPAGVAVMLFAWIVFAVSKFAHVTAVLTVLCHRSRSGWLGALKGVATKLPKLTRLALLGLALITAAALPGLLVVGLGAWPIVAGEFDINYYLAERPPVFTRSLWIAGIGAALVVSAVGYLLLRTCLALPIVLYEDATPRSAVRESLRYTRGRKGSIVRGLLGFLAVAAVISLVSIGASTLIGWCVSVAPPAWWGIGVAVLLAGVQIVVGEATSLTLSSLAAVSLGIIYERAKPGQSPPAMPPPVQLPALLRWRRGLLVWGPIAVAVLLNLAATITAAVQAIPTDRPLVIAHRGLIADAPENSLLAFEHALDAGADVIELDVQRAADGVAVVVHDADLKRVAGLPGRVGELTSTRLTQTTLLGSGNQTMPTLEQALAAVTPRGRVLIELKYYGFDGELVPAVLEVIDRLGVRDRVLLMSLESRGVAQARSLAPDIPVGLTVATSLGDLDTVDADFLAIGTRLATPKRVSDLRAAGLDVFVWTVNDPADMNRLLTLGVDGLITDAPATAAQRSSQTQERSGVERAIAGLRTRLDL